MKLQNGRLILFSLAIIAAAWLMATKKIIIHQDPYYRPTPTIVPNPKTSFYPLTVGTKNLQTEIRQTAAEQELGLSWRTSMGENEAMTFKYSTSQKVLFWMKGMQFPLDFIWVKQGRVIELTQEVAAPTQQNPIVRTIIPQTEIDMVIEVNAGFIEKNHIQVGDSVILKPNP